jgi:hypothetical protein
MDKFTAITSLCNDSIVATSGRLAAQAGPLQLRKSLGFFLQPEVISSVAAY